MDPADPAVSVAMVALLDTGTETRGLPGHHLLQRLSSDKAWDNVDCAV